MTAPISISQGINSHQFHAFLRDEQGIVKMAFNRRIEITKPDDDLIIKQIEARSDRAAYEINRTNVRNDMDSDEHYRVTLLASREITSGGSGNVILIKPEKYSWFAEAGQVSIKGQEETEKRVGTLMMVNPDNVALLKGDGAGAVGSWFFPVLPSAHYWLERCRTLVTTAFFNSEKSDSASVESDANIHQLLEMLSSTARQSYLHEVHPIDGLPILTDSHDADPLLCQWPLLKDAGERYLDRKDGVPETLAGIVNDMSSLVETLVSMHARGVAHGDIKLGGLRVIDGRVGPGNPERFSVVGQTAGPDKLGKKRFIFYNNGYHAPELRFPGTLGSTDPEFKPWQYTSVTKEGDVWSFGLLLAVMLCRIPGGREKLEKAGILKSSLSEYMKTSGKYDCTTLEKAIADGKCARFLLNTKSLLELNLPTKNCLARQRATLIPAEDKKKLGQLVTLVANCTHHNPEQRPSAEKLQEALGGIIP